ncbi:hypothetical protein CH302_19485 [Rhodococcus sp. 15-2388-1-1a]|uniref:hypothetical protein n=1 Tax=Nocardiaceae TaxID=85025 RepID=UPI000562AA03|nr:MULTISPECIES: hypothetical protein [Rhodococcus]OZE95124.1 hypothetical protein CH302_19485 [Rhodococcus sp. 15-2388-1-1a]
MNGTRIVPVEDLRPGDVIVKKVDQTFGGRFIETSIDQLTVGRISGIGPERDRITVFDLEHTRTEFFPRGQRLRIHRESN